MYSWIILVSQYDLFIQNQSSADTVENLDAAHLCFDMIWGYVVNVGMRCAENLWGRTQVSSSVEEPQTWSEERPKRKKKMEVMQIRFRGTLGTDMRPPIWKDA